MIVDKTGDILLSKAAALCNPVNTKGIMGKGLAFQFKQEFPRMFLAYKTFCEQDRLTPGGIFVWGDSPYIISVATKDDWRKPSEYSYVQTGLANIKKYVVQNEITSIAIPPLGAGLGGLDKNRVKELISRSFENSKVIIELWGF